MVFLLWLILLYLNNILGSKPGRMVNQADDFLLFCFFLRSLCKKGYIFWVNRLNILIFNSENALFEL